MGSDGVAVAKGPIVGREDTAIGKCERAGGVFDILYFHNLAVDEPRFAAIGLKQELVARSKPPGMAPVTTTPTANTQSSATKPRASSRRTSTQQTKTQMAQKLVAPQITATSAGKYYRFFPMDALPLIVRHGNLSQRCHRGVSWVYQRCPRSVTALSQSTISGVARLVSAKYQRCPKVVRANDTGKQERP